MLRKRRGIALILALFTTAILIILSVSFLVLAMGESRNSRTASYEAAAVQAANFGIGFTINYMGRGGVVPSQPGAVGTGTTIWRTAAPQASPAPPDALINVLRENVGLVHPGSPNVQVGYPVHVTTIPGQTGIQAERNRRVSIANATTGVRALIPLGRDLQFSVFVDVVPILNRGVISYQLSATSEVFPLPQNGSPPLARRRIEARVLEESVGSYLHFVSNARSTNVQGQTSGEMDNGFNVNNSPGNIIFQRSNILATNVVIPPDYVENGPMRVDGQINSGLNTTNTFANASGHLAFGPGTSDPAHKPKFQEPLSINRLSNLYQDGGLDDTTAGFFSGGLNIGTTTLGLPDFEKSKATMRQVSQIRTQTGSESGLIEFPTSSLMGTGPVPPQYQPVTRFAPTNPPPDEIAYAGNPYVERMEVRNINGQDVKVPVAPDYRPRFPNVELNFQNDQVTITNVSTLDGSQLSPPKTFNLKQFERGVLFVEGGNAVITGGTNVTGQLTVVATERADNPTAVPPVFGRERPNATVVDAAVPKLVNGQAVPSGQTYLGNFNSAYNSTTAVSNETIYAQAAREFDDWNRARADQISRMAGISNDERRLLYNDVVPPPYSIAQLTQARAQGRIPASTPIPGGNPARRLFPPPSTRLSPKAEREGNIIMAGDFNYNKQDRSTSIGFLAQNFVLLNDRTPLDNDKKLTLNGVMMSGERSMQLDWDNTGRQDRSAHAQLIASGYNGTLNLKGSIVGEHIDVDGDYDKRGYFTQNFEHDRQLLQQRPPYFPRWDFERLTGPFRFSITHYVDRGTLTTENAAPSP